MAFYQCSLLFYYSTTNNTCADGRYYFANLVTILFLEGLVNGMPSRSDHSGVHVVSTSAGKRGASVDWPKFKSSPSDTCHAKLILSTGNSMILSLWHSCFTN